MKGNVVRLRVAIRHRECDSLGRVGKMLGQIESSMLVALGTRCCFPLQVWVIVKRLITRLPFHRFHEVPLLPN